MRSTADMQADREIPGAGIKVESALVSGATGHIGSALLRRLVGSGVRVAALVRKNSPGRSRLPDHKLVSVVEIDRENSGSWHESVRQFGAEIVFNLASTGVSPSERDPIAMLDGNARLLASLLDGVAVCEPRRFIHTGSCSEYGAAETGHPITEDHPAKPSSLYGAAKLCASIYGAALAAQYRIPFFNLRLFGVFGPGESPHRVVPYLIAKLRAGQPVDLTPGCQVRDWLYEEDVVDALLAAATSDTLGDGGVFNVCSCRGTSVRELAEQVADAMNKPRALLRFGSRPYRFDEPMWIVGDNRRFTAATSWQPRVSVAEGIRRMVVQLA
jgi:UDP-glucose 4-epimerase